MPRTLTARQPTAAEVRRLLDDLEAKNLTAPQRRRAEVLLLYAQGWNAVEIAASLSLHPNTVYTILRIFDRMGLDGIAQVGRGGATPRLTVDQRATILWIADQPPYQFGLPQGRWSLANLRNYLIRQRVLKTISREHLRRVLKKGGFGSTGSSTNSEAKTGGDPRFWLKSDGFGVIFPPRG
jgi:transposase